MSSLVPTFNNIVLISGVVVSFETGPYFEISTALVGGCKVLIFWIWVQTFTPRLQFVLLAVSIGVGFPTFMIPTIVI